MKYYILIFLSVMVSFHAFSQYFTVFDTLKINEVEVAYKVPLNNNDKLNLYQQFQPSSIDEINAGLSGISLMRRGGYAFEPVMNSFSAGQLNITIDGMKMFGACTDKMDPITSYVETINLESLELDFGTSGSKYGSTIGGAFNMLLHQPELNKDTLVLGSRYNSVSKGNEVSFVVNLGRQSWAYRSSGNVRNHNSYHDGNGKVVPFTQFKKINLQQALLFQSLKGHSFIAQVLIDNAYDVGYAALPMDVALAKGRIYSVEFISGKPLWGIQRLKAKVYANTVYHLMDDSGRDSLYMVPNSKSEFLDSVYMKMDMPGWSNTFGAYLEGSYVFGPKNRLFVRIEDYVNISRAEMTMFMNNLSHPGEPPMYTETWPEVSRQVSGVYLKNERSLGTKHSFSIDARADYSFSRVMSEQGIQQFRILGYETEATDIEKAFAFNLNLKMGLGVKSRLNLGSGYGERLPTLSEKYGFYLFNAFDGYDYIGNPFLENERSINLWEAYQFSGKHFKLNFENQLNWVRNYILGEVNYEMQALNLYASGLKQYHNIDGAFLWSSNLETWYRPWPKLEVGSLLKYNWGNKKTGGALPLIAPLKGMFSVVYSYKNTMVMLQNESSSAQNRIDMAYGEVVTPGYTLFHLKGNYQLPVQKSLIKFNVQIENLFNVAYSEHLDWGSYFRAGRNVGIGLEIQL